MGKMVKALFWVLLALVYCPGMLMAQEDDAKETDGVMSALSGEVERAMGELAPAATSPYYIGAEITEMEVVQLRAEDGALHDPMHSKRRFLDVDVRVGDPALDSSHPLRKSGGAGRSGSRPLVLTEDQNVLQRLIYLQIDKAFQIASERWAKVKSEKDTLVKESVGPDLSPEESITYLGPRHRLQFDLERWQQVIKKASAFLADSPVVHDGGLDLTAFVENRWYVNSDKTKLRHGQNRFRLTIKVYSVADDGQRLALRRSFEAHDEKELPSETALIETVKSLDAKLQRLRKAPVQEPYTGPVVLSGRAAAVFFHEILGHRLEGHRLRQVSDAQTFRHKLGQPILPTFLSVFDDPTEACFEEQALFGHYAFDNQGVPAQRANLVKEGVLVGFLESRAPASQDGFSNGHGRRQSGMDAVTRQGNLYVQAHREVPMDSLRQRLLAEARKAGHEYGLWIDEIEGGFTFTGRTIPNAFKVNVVLARRIYVDGRPDELIRGIDLIGTPLVAFSRITLAGQDHEVFNGYCGAESGKVPVSGIAPALLISQVELQRKAKAQNMPPLLPPPTNAYRLQIKTKK
jgi:predicted Zn-dependent protease